MLLSVGVVSSWVIFLRVSDLILISVLCLWEICTRCSANRSMAAPRSQQISSLNREASAVEHLVQSEKVIIAQSGEAGFCCRRSCDFIMIKWLSTFIKTIAV